MPGCGIEFESIANDAAISGAKGNKKYFFFPHFPKSHFSQSVLFFLRKWDMWNMPWWVFLLRWGWVHASFCQSSLALKLKCHAYVNDMYENQINTEIRPESLSTKSQEPPSITEARQILSYVTNIVSPDHNRWAQANGCATRCNRYQKRYN